MSRLRNWSISAGVHFSTLISRAVSRISNFFVFASSVIGPRLGVAWRVSSSSRAAEGVEAEAEDPPAAQPEADGTSPHFCFVPPVGGRRNARPSCFPQHNKHSPPPPP